MLSICFVGAYLVNKKWIGSNYSSDIFPLSGILSSYIEMLF